MNLSQATLEALVVDRAAGELSPEAELLLAAYLEEHPETAAESRQLDAIMDLAREAVDYPRPRERDLPAPKFAQGHSPAGWAWRWPESWRPLPWAAGLAVGLVFGWLSGGRLGLPEPASKAGMLGAGVAHPTLAAAAPVPAVATFWSPRAYAERVAAPPVRPAFSLVWESPARIPRVKEN